jgi:hypothetical protein
MTTLKMIINCDVAKTTANLAKIPAFSDGTPENTIYWTDMSKGQVKEFFDYGMICLAEYSSNQVGATVGAEILGALEDTYPDWVEEFENAL